MVPADQAGFRAVHRHFGRTKDVILTTSEVRERLRELQRKAGYLQRQLEDLENRARLIELVDELSKRKALLEDSIKRLQIRNEQLRHAQAQRLARAYTLIADEIRKLLHNDLPRELTFEKARNIEFDFVTNKISVDGETYFSASSRVILKSSFSWVSWLRLKSHFSDIPVFA